MAKKWYHFDPWHTIITSCLCLRLHVLFCVNIIAEVNNGTIATWLCLCWRPGVWYKAPGTLPGPVTFPWDCCQGNFIFLYPISSITSSPLSGIPNTCSYNGNYWNIKRVLHMRLFLCANVPKKPKNWLLFFHLWMLAIRLLQKEGDAYSRRKQNVGRRGRGQPWEGRAFLLIAKHAR